MSNVYVLSTGVEPARPKGHQPLKLARLPFRHESIVYVLVERLELPDPEETWATTTGASSYALHQHVCFACAAVDVVDGHRPYTFPMNRVGVTRHGRGTVDDGLDRRADSCASVESPRAGNTVGSTTGAAESGLNEPVDNRFGNRCLDLALMPFLCSVLKVPPSPHRVGPLRTPPKCVLR